MAQASPRPTETELNPSLTTRRRPGGSSKDLIVSPSSNPDMQQFLRLTVEHLVEQAESDRWLIAGPEQLSGTEPFARFEYLALGDGRNSLKVGKVGRWLKGFPALLKVFLGSEPKLVVFLGVHIDNLPLYLLGSLCRARMVFVVHDWMAHPGWKAKFIELNNWLIKKVLGDACIFYSNQGCSEWKGRGLKIPVVLGGFPQKVFEPKAGARCLLFFGRMEHYKGLHHLVTLGRVMAQNLPDWKIVVAGAGHDPALSELEGQPNVEVINRFIPDGEVDELFQQASFTILPYDSATQSGVIVLSFAHGTPVIAHAVGALPEYLPAQAGTLVRPGDHQAIVRFLAGLDEQAILDCSRAAIQAYLANHTPKSFKCEQWRAIRAATEADSAKG